MIVTRKEVYEAEEFAQRQRVDGARWLVVDASKAPTEDARAQAVRAGALAKDDPVKFEAILRNKSVTDLFVCGALRFQP